jgi:hypothetical protein
MPYRHLSVIEIEIIAFLLSKRRKAAEVFLQHRNEFMCTDIDEFGSISICPGIPVLDVDVNGPVGDAVMPNHSEGSLDGTRINLILFAQGKELSELQIYTDDGSAIDAPIDVGKIEFM